ncbi:MAG: hypothetical protein QMD25_04445 [Caldisericia bacterium]|jgi:uncharacterized protein YwgA|nr:hypothetical protein [Caldisericia bacterium]
MNGSFWEKIKKGLKVSAEKTKEFAEIANLKGSILVLEGKKGGKLKELGTKVYDLYKQGKSKDEIFEAVQSIFEEIKKIENEIKEKEEEIEKIRSQKGIKEEEVKKIEEEVKKEVKEESGQ